MNIKTPIVLLVGIVLALVVLRFLVIKPVSFLLGFGVEASGPLSPLHLWTSLVLGILLISALLWAGGYLVQH
jgi:hypothetical protein